MGQYCGYSSPGERRITPAHAEGNIYVEFSDATGASAAKQSWPVESLIIAR